jgi:hypothetical protein
MLNDEGLSGAGTVLPIPMLDAGGLLFGAKALKERLWCSPESELQGAVGAGRGIPTPSQSQPCAGMEMVTRLGHMHGNRDKLFSPGNVTSC